MSPVFRLGWQRVVALAVPLLVSVASAALVSRAMFMRNTASAEVRGSLDQLDRIDDLRLRIVDAETGQRGFIITGDERYLAPYRGAERDVWRGLAALRLRAQGQPEDLRMLDSIAGLVRQRFGVLNERVGIRRERGFEAARNAVATGGGREIMARLRTALDSLEAAERRDLILRERAELRFSRAVFWAVSVGALLVIGTLLLTGMIFHRYARATRAAAEEIEEANVRLQDQAVELEAQSEELQAQTAELEETVGELQATQDELLAQQAQLEAVSAELEENNRDLLHANLLLGEQTARAEEANRAKADFLATMSHELRTPLNAVGGYADLLEMGVHGPVTEPQREALARIRRNQQYLLGLIEDILNFARVEAGNIEVRSLPVNVGEILAGMESVVAPLMASRGLEYRCDPCDAEWLATGDRERIEQVLLNLLTNAAKFTAPGGRVRLWAEAAAGAVHIRVRDSGRGIPAEQLQSVFEPFVQLQRTPSQGSAQGVGLGLAISRELGRAMGGDLTAESEVGVGSTFTLTLPAAEPSATTLDGPSTPLSGA